MPTEIEKISWSEISHLFRSSNNNGHVRKTPSYDILKMWASQCMTQYQGGDPGDECGRMQRFMETSTEIDWSSTFQKPLVLIYEDMIDHRHLICIHHWLRSKALDIENIILLNNHHIGMAQWYEQWKLLHHEPGFHVVEWPFVQSTVTIEKMRLPEFRLPDLDFIRQQKSHRIRKLFSFYGGRHNIYIDKFYAMLKCLEFGESAVVDTASYWMDPSTMSQYLEYVTDYCDQAEVVKLMEIYHTYRSESNDFVNPALDPYLIQHQKCQSLMQPNVEYWSPSITYQDLQWAIDRECFVSVIRETLMDQPYDILTEKTYRAFLHYTVPMPLTYQSADNLQSLGYRLPWDLIDYSYTQEPRYRLRVQKAMDQLRMIQTKMSHEDMNRYWNDNLDLLHHNATTTAEKFNQTYHCLRYPTLDTGQKNL